MRLSKHRKSPTAETVHKDHYSLTKHVRHHLIILVECKELFPLKNDFLCMFQLVTKKKRAIRNNEDSTVLRSLKNKNIAHTQFLKQWNERLKSKYLLTNNKKLLLVTLFCFNRPFYSCVLRCLAFE